MVIGSTGFIGGHTAAALADAGFRVPGTSTEGDGAELACDIESPESVDEALRQIRPDNILVTAGRSSVAEAWADSSGAFRTNTRGTFNLLEGMRRIVPGSFLTLVSSASVYGTPEAVADLPFSEEATICPASPYGTSKAAAEILAGQYAREFCLRIAVARVFNQIGPGQSEAQAPAEFAREIAMAERRGDQKLDLEIGNPDARRDYTDVRDTARAFTGIIDGQHTGTFNICSGAAVSMLEIATGLAAHSSVEAGVELRPDRAHRADVPMVLGTAERLKAATGWEPQIPLGESLRDLLDDWRRRA